MDAVTMLAATRTLLDEDIEEFWLDTEIYSALSDGQKEYASIILSHFEDKCKIDPSEAIPETLTPLFTHVSGTNASSFNLPTDYWFDIYMKVTISGGSGAIINVPRINNSREQLFLLNNSLKTDPYYTISKSTVTMSNLMSTYSLYYIQAPTDIDATPTDPVLPVYTHDAIVRYAFSKLLQKSPERANESPANYNQFLSMIKYI